MDILAKSLAFVKPLSRQHIYYNAFNLTGKIGAKRFRRLLNFFPDLETAWSAPAKELTRAGLGESVTRKILERRESINPEAEFDKLQSLDVRLITIEEPDYPRLLKEIHNPPAVLYIRGSVSALDQLAVSVVGSRKMTRYGKQAAQDLVRDLVRAGLTIVSGLALGLDAMAHQTALEFEGDTIGVLACGVDTIYPSSNRLIGENIIQRGGAVISELPVGTPPLKHNFPNRNRIISGLALGTIVVEAASQSGALITARHALEQNREVFAVPGSIYNPMSRGPNQLILQGARPVLSAQSVLDELNLQETKQQLIAEQITGDNEQEQTVLDQLSKQPVHIDQIIKSSGLPASKTASVLTVLELKGKVKNLGSNNYVLGK